MQITYLNKILLVNLISSSMHVAEILTTWGLLESYNRHSISVHRLPLANTRKICYW